MSYNVVFLFFIYLRFVFVFSMYFIYFRLLQFMFFFFLLFYVFWNAYQKLISVNKIEIEGASYLKTKPCCKNGILFCYFARGEPWTLVIVLFFYVWTLRADTKLLLVVSVVCYYQCFFLG